jgi:CheY-like chemotaxis protein
MPTRILIAEDNPVVRNALHSLLERSGPWEIVDAQNGEEALAKAQELKPNLIILDLVMPVMDGLAAAKQISKLLPEIPILMHTMHWSSQVEVEAQKVGVRKVVSKADNRQLISSIQKFLSLEPAVAVAAPAIPSDIATDAAPAVAILEAAGPAAVNPDPPSPAPADKTEAPATGANADVSEGGQPN